MGDSTGIILQDPMKDNPYAPSKEISLSEEDAHVREVRGPSASQSLVEFLSAWCGCVLFLSIAIPPILGGLNLQRLTTIFASTFIVFVVVWQRIRADNPSLRRASILISGAVGGLLASIVATSIDHATQRFVVLLILVVSTMGTLFGALGARVGHQLSVQRWRIQRSEDR